jgi:hypothetical protein
MHNEEYLDFLLSEENKWRKSQPDYSFYDLIEMFPGAEMAAKRGIAERIRVLKKEIAGRVGRQDFLLEIWGKWSGESYHREMLEILEKEMDEYVEERETEIKRLSYQKRYLTTGDPISPGMTGVTQDLVRRAKEMPITNYIKFNSQQKAKCIWHEEKSPSLHYNKKGNTIYCFSCTKYADVIGVVMAQQGLTFPDAVKRIMNI